MNSPLRSPDPPCASFPLTWRGLLLAAALVVAVLAVTSSDCNGVVGMSEGSSRACESAR